MGVKWENFKENFLKMIAQDFVNFCGITDLKLAKDKLTSACTGIRHIKETHVKKKYAI